MSAEQRENLSGHLLAYPSVRSGRYGCQSTSIMEAYHWSKNASRTESWKSYTEEPPVYWNLISIVAIVEEISRVNDQLHLNLPNQYHTDREPNSTGNIWWNLNGWKVTWPETARIILVGRHCLFIVVLYMVYHSWWLHNGKRLNFRHDLWVWIGLFRMLARLQNPS